jgi:hypothetical protein
MACGPACSERRQIGLAQEEQYCFLFIQKNSKWLELIRSKDGLPMLEIFQTKYGSEYFELRNNFP